MKVIIAGGRDFKDYDLLSLKCNLILEDTPFEEIEIVSGTARGADLLGEDYANKCSYPIKKFPADWDKYGKSAGHRRNAEMAEYADALICFWDGSSRGTKSMIELAKKKGLKIRIIKY